MISSEPVFLIDDNVSARHGLGRLLRAASYDVREFGSVNEFLDALDPETSGCVILDAGMLGLSRERLQAELASRTLHLPIIVVAADDCSEIRQEAQEMVAAGFFRKPVDGTALLDAIEWALGSSSTGPNDKEE